MQDRIQQLERRRLLRAAREYRKQGYRVVLNPAKSDLPEFLNDFPVDMIGKRGDETVVVEVRSYATLSVAPPLSAIARSLEGHSGWRLDLIVTNPRITASEKHQRARLTQAFHTILLTEWNPIEVRDASDAQDEYDSYIAPLIDMLEETGSEEAITDYLCAVQTERMGLEPDCVRARRAAEQIVGAWKRHRSDDGTKGGKHERAR